MKAVRKYLIWILPVFLLVGYFYSAIGLIALICMLAPVIMAAFKGRYWCGNFCPRGIFYDHALAKISPKKAIPPFFSSKGLRIFMIVFIMTMFSVQMYSAWGDFNAMGMVFVQLIFVTTVIGIVLGVLYNQRTWCSFCPMGTMASWLSPNKKPLQVENSCVNCKLCSKACPFGLEPYTAKGDEKGFSHADCLKCSVCVEKCPKKALKF